MPVKSAKQFRMMEAAAHGGLKGMAGPSAKVAKEFLDKTPEGTKSTFAKENKFSNSMRKKKK
jgi:hypothetical protein